MLFLSNDDVSQVLTMQDTLDALDESYHDLAAEEAVCRPRIDIRIPTPDPEKVYQWGTMEGGSTRGYFAIRMKSDVLWEQSYGGTRTQEKYCREPGRYCGLVLLLDIRTGEPLAMINDGLLQHWRVGADSAIGAKYMAPADARVVGMIGSGGMARSHLEAFCLVRPIERVKVYSPTSAHRDHYAKEMADKLGVEVVPCADPKAVYEDVQILAGCTDASEAVIRGAWLEPGTHVTAVGGWPDSKTWQKVGRCLRFGNATRPVGIDEWPLADEYIGFRARPHDPVWEKQSRLGRRAHGVWPATEVVTLADIFSGTPARPDPDAITYSERGNLQGAQFYAIAGRIYEAARARGLGREVPTDWLLQDIRD